MLLVRCDCCGKEEPFIEDCPTPPDGWMDYSVTVREFHSGGSCRSEDSHRLYTCDECNGMSLTEVVEAIEQRIKSDMKQEMTHGD